MKSIKILSGQFKNRLIYFQDRDHLRPQSHYMRQCLFNILIHRFLTHRMHTEKPFDGMKVLDLFAGTGSFGIEALSRGAKHVTFVENNGCTAARLEGLLDHWGLSDRSHVLYQSFPCDINVPVYSDDNLFDIIFLDPPYCNKIEKVTEFVQSAVSFLSNTGIIVLEYPLLLSEINEVHCALSRTKGKKRISFFGRKSL